MDRLTRLLRAYALYDPSVGYVQGLHFVAAPLLLYLRDEEAFTLLVALMKRHGLRELYLTDMPALHARLYQFDRLIEDRVPVVHVHLQRCGVASSMYASQWFLTLFAHKLPPEAAARVLDLVVVAGLDGVLQIGLAMVQRSAQKILAKSKLEELLAYLKDGLIDEYRLVADTSSSTPGGVGIGGVGSGGGVDGAKSPTGTLTNGVFGSHTTSQEGVYDGDLLLRDALAVSLDASKLEEYVRDHASAVEEQRLRELEASALKSSNTTLAATVKSLEEQLEKLNLEHVNLANDLIGARMSLAKLEDENEALQGSVRGLKAIVDKQPAEVEEKLKEEMRAQADKSRLTASENRRLENRLAEVEQELINLKMQHAAEVDEHNSLKHKWEYLRKSLGPP